MSTRYADWSPTHIDSRGLRLPDRQDWLVAPIIQTLDSGILEESNFAVVLADLGGESEFVEVHRFGHWGPGWFEIVLVHPSKLDEVEAWEEALSMYPVASDDDFSEREAAAAQTAWERLSLKERVELCSKAQGVSIFAARHDWVPSDEYGPLIQERLMTL